MTSATIDRHILPTPDEIRELTRALYTENRQRINDLYLWPEQARHLGQRLQGVPDLFLTGNPRQGPMSLYGINIHVVDPVPTEVMRADFNAAYLTNAEWADDFLAPPRPTFAQERVAVWHPAPRPNMPDLGLGDAWARAINGIRDRITGVLTPPVAEGAALRPEPQTMHSEWRAGVRQR